MNYEVAAASTLYDVGIEEEPAGLRVTVGGVEHMVQIDSAAGSGHLRLLIDGRAVPVAIQRAGAEVTVVLGYERYRLQVRPKLPIIRRGAEPAGPPVTQINAPMPGLVVSVEAAPGAAIEPGHPVIILEAMKMQMEIRAPVRGRVETVRVRPGQEVARGQVLATIEPAAAEERDTPSRG